MLTRMSWQVALLPVACLLLLTVASGQGQPPSTGAPPVPSFDPDVPPAKPAATRPVVPPAASSVDDLISKLESVRKQKAELEKQEQAVLQQLKERLKQQGDRLSKLGVLPTPPAPPPPPDVPTIFIGPDPLKDGPDKVTRPPGSK